VALACGPYLFVYLSAVVVLYFFFIFSVAVPQCKLEKDAGTKKNNISVERFEVRVTCAGECVGVTGTKPTVISSSVPNLLRISTCQTARAKLIKPLHFSGLASALVYKEVKGTSFPDVLSNGATLPPCTFQLV
jgi:hypothetical protein